MEYNNETTLEFKSLSENESLARACVASFCAILNPTIEQLADIKTAVSEAVTNCVVHAYPNNVGNVLINVKIVDREIFITITDFGIGISDIDKAREPFFTSKPSIERSGMGFTVMESFMDGVVVHSKPNFGTEVKLIKKLEAIRCVVGG